MTKFTWANPSGGPWDVATNWDSGTVANGGTADVLFNLPWDL